MRPFNRAYLYTILPLCERQTHWGVGGRVRRYEKLERLSLQENEARQWKSVLQLLLYAYEGSPFYRRRFDDADLRPEDISSPSDLQNIPPLTREEIRENLEDLRSRRYRPEELLSAATGGTTDTPVPIYRSLRSVREKVAVHLRFNMWGGFMPGVKVFHLWGARQDFLPNPPLRWRIYDRYLMRQVAVPTSLLNEQVLETYRQELNRFQPRVIYAYPTALALFCEYLRDSCQPYYRPASAICTAEPLMDQQRQVIEETLGCPVFELYGSRESGIIAGECECHRGLHLNPAAAYVEFLPVEGAEVSGLHEMLITDLLNDGMPLIRYRINDCVILADEACPCGRGYPLVRQILGRTGDVFQLPNGDKVPGVALTNRVLQVCPGLKKVQVIQESLEDFHVRYVPGPEFTASDIHLLRTNLGRFFPDGLRWSFEQVEEIERERSGKTRFCISRIANQGRNRTHAASATRP